MNLLCSIVFCTFFSSIQSSQSKESRESNKKSRRAEAQEKFDKWIDSQNKLEIINFYKEQGDTKQMAKQKYLDEAIKRFQNTLHEARPTERFNFAKSSS